MLSPAHLRTVGLLTSEVARPRPLTTAESSWVTRVLGGLGQSAQAACELRMGSTGPLLVCRAGAATVEVTPAGTGSVAVVARAGRGVVTHRFADDLDVVGFLLGLEVGQPASA